MLPERLNDESQQARAAKRYRTTQTCGTTSVISIQIRMSATAEHTLKVTNPIVPISQRTTPQAVPLSRSDNQTMTTDSMASGV